MSINQKPVSCIECQQQSCAVKILHEDELRLLDRNSTEVKFSKGESIIKQGSFISSVIYIREGLVKEHMTGPGKKEQILKLTKPSSYIGIPSIFGQTYNHYSATALEDTTTCFINHETFRLLTKRNAAFAYQVLLFVCREGICTWHVLVNQSQKQLTGRVADLLLHLSNEVFKADAFSIPLSRQEMANYVSTSRESISRTLIDLDRDGIIQLDGRNILLTDKNKLEKISRKG